MHNVSSIVLLEVLIYKYTVYSIRMFVIFVILFIGLNFILLLMYCDIRINIFGVFQVPLESLKELMDISHVNFANHTHAFTGNSNAFYFNL